MSFYTQQELAGRWKCSTSTIIRKRDKGLIPCFRIDNGKPLYPVEEIHEYEKQKTTTYKSKEVPRKPVIKKSVVSVKPSTKEWRID